MTEAARHKFQELDGLRGVAAVCVMLWHRREWFGGDGFLGHAYLAVDFFFMLSGFVIAHAYGSRLANGEGIGRFFRDRVIRLHPLLIAGALLGCAVFLVDVHLGKKPKPALLPLTLLSSFVPFPPIWPTGGEAFPINNPEWSLFWELLINVVFALIIVRLSNRRLLTLISVCAVAMVYCSFVSTGFKGGRVQAELWQGLPRVGLSFLIGVLLLRLFRRGVRVNIPHVPGLPALVLVTSFALLPVWHPWSKFYDPIVVIAVYPVLLLWAASAVPAMPRFTALGGALSYPIYVLHVPLLQLLSGLRQTVFHSPISQPGLAGALLEFCIIIATCYAALRLYDEPIRLLLRRRFTSKTLAHS